MEEIKMERKNVNCEIQEPSVELKDSYLSALDEYKSAGIPLDNAVKEFTGDFDQYIKQIQGESQGKNMEPGYVPQTTYWITDKDGYAGRISIRHELNDFLLKSGGHIGYGIIPSKRGLHYGTKALELVLPKARAMGLKKVLLTCDSTNTGSKKIMEANGGILENEVPGENGEVSKLRYWIEL